ncbi:MAG: hypothetical protein V5A46_07755 [Haloferacaceae archaeon]
MSLAGALDPGLITDASGPARAVGSFVWVLIVGGAVLRYRGAFVDRSTDAWLERPAIAVVYGATVYGLVLFATGYVFSQIARLAPASGRLVQGLVVVAGLLLLAVTAVGFTVVGIGLTEIESRRRPWAGLALGAAISAVVWVGLPFALGLVAWILLASVGVGGPMRRWVHADEPARSSPG